MPTSPSDLTPTTTTIHDATVGFNDIKALPVFELENNWPLIAAGLPIILACIFLLYLFAKRTKPTAQPTPKTPPDRIALERLRELETARAGNTISVRDFGTSLSEILRAYTEATTSLPALEMTAAELARSFPPAFRKALPVLPDSTRNKLTTEFLSIIRQSERLTFANNIETQVQLEDSALGEILEQSSSVIKEATHFLKKENERRASVIHPTTNGATTNAV